MIKKAQKGLKTIGAMALVTVLVACSANGGGNNIAVNSANVGKSPQPSTTAEQTAAPDNSAVKGDIKVLSIYAEGQAETFKKVMEKFNETYPNVKVTYMMQGIHDLPALISAGDTPDVILGGGGHGNYPAFWITDNLIQDLTPFIEKDKFFSTDSLYETAYKRGIDSDGKIWQLPYSVDPNFTIVYNRDVLEQYGNTELPEMNSLQGFEDFVKSYWIAENGEQVMTTGSPLDLYGNWNTFTTFAYLNGADSNTFYNPETNKATFNDPKIVETLEWLVRFKREYIDDERMKKLSDSLPENSSRLIAGKSLMEINVVQHAQENLRLNPDLEVAPMPSESLWQGGLALFMTTLGKKENEEAAWSLIKWISSSKEAAEINLQLNGVISAAKDNPYLLKQAESDPALKVAYDILQRAKKLPPFPPVHFQFEFDAKYREVLDGKLEPKAFLDHMTTFIQALLDEQKP
ncbi:ABC-type glycerol-3-phosphate transport system, substrate-binding protein [Paenibacillaceae bacterium GAS479]|nr:ABC-type glycerol-3-phosphate transport system, substrate-binding protein [Paenibacillaceae bacterium GAS479]